MGGTTSARRRHRRSLLLLATGLVALGLAGGAQSNTADAAATLSIGPITWDVIGLDSNDVQSGPDTFPVGGRVCNSGGDLAPAVAVRFVWDSATGFVELEHRSTIDIGSLGAGACQDVYFNVVVQRTVDAFETARRYHLEVLADDVVVAATPRPRELYVERLVSQNRNQVDAITGPGGAPPDTELTVGDIVEYELVGGTAPNGYEQLEVYLNFPNSVFRVLGVDAVYTGPAGGTNDSVYADACGWDADPSSPDYRTCVGPETWGGKAGGDVVLRYRLEVVGAGSGTVFGLIHDFSGSSYHYNADFGQDGLPFIARELITTTAPPASVVPSTVRGPAPTTAPPAIVIVGSTTVPTTAPTPTWDPSFRLPDTGSSTTTVAVTATLLMVAGWAARRIAGRTRTTSGHSASATPQ